MQSNPFLTYLEEHRDAGLSALKELFRILAKRTHPDLGAADERQFVRLQEYYHEALAVLLRDRPDAATIAGEPGSRTPREIVLGALYRYRALLPSRQLEPRELPRACMAAYAVALETAHDYDARALDALDAFDRQFHGHRPQVARYPDVVVKYKCLLSGLASFFDYQLGPNAFNDRVARSYLAELLPISDVDPNAPMTMRHNRSAAARSALYRMRTWLEHELDLPPAEVAI